VFSQRSQRFDKEIVLALLSLALGLLTLLWQDWLEVTGWEPDHRGGAIEWMIAASFLLIALVLGFRGATKSTRSRHAYRFLDGSEDVKRTNRWL
jgi:hypothetical protein